MFNIKRINEDYRSSSKSLSNSIKTFIEKNKGEIDHLASEDMWEEIHSMLADNFPDEDEDVISSEFSKMYGAPIEECGDEEENDHRNVSRVAATSYPGMAKSAMGVNQKLTESIVKRLSDF